MGVRPMTPIPGVIIMSGRHRSQPVKDEQIVELYREIQSVRKVAKALGIGDTTVARVLAKLGERMIGPEDVRLKARVFTPEQGEEICRLYEEEGFTVGELVKEFGGSVWSVKSAIRNAGGSIRQTFCPDVRPGEDEEILRLRESGMSQMKISLAIGRSQGFVSRVLRRHGIVSFKPTGENHSMWNGGRWVNGSGYTMVKVENDDPLACMRNQNGYVLEHRLALARKLGRSLLPTETVHHINGDTKDNRPENLQLRQGRHGNGVVLCCRDCGSRNIGPVPIEEED